MVEFALIAPLLALLVFGLIEMGMAWRDTLTVNAASRSGVRIASNLGDERLADWAALSAVKAGLGDIDDADIQAVIVYNPEADGSVPTDCLDNGGTSVAGQCNHYDANQVLNLVEADFTGTTGCGAGSPDEFWCPVDRSTRQGSLDHVGVYVRIEYDPKTQILPMGSLTIDDNVVMRIEPRLRSSV